MCPKPYLATWTAIYSIKFSLGNTFFFLGITSLVSGGWRRIRMTDRLPGNLYRLIRRLEERTGKVCETKSLWKPKVRNDLLTQYN